jgi:aromatic ring-opening dioxygenase catalytic subunit (LigB family)
MYFHLSRKLLMIAPLLIWPERLPSRTPLDAIGGPKGPHAQFLKDFGTTLLEKYNPKAIVVFSAHWETHGHIEGTSKHCVHIPRPAPSCR